MAQTSEKPVVTRTPDGDWRRALVTVTFSHFSLSVGSDISAALASDLSEPWLCIPRQGHQHLPPTPRAPRASLMLMRHSDGRPTRARGDTANYLLSARGAQGTRGDPRGTNTAAGRARLMHMHELINIAVWRPRPRRLLARLAPPPRVPA